MIVLPLLDLGILLLVNEDRHVMACTTGQLHQLGGQPRVGLALAEELNGLGIEGAQGISCHWLEHFTLIL